MTTETTPRRGRKPTGQALTNAERQARHKAKLAARAAEADRLAEELARVTHERDALKAEAALVTTRPLVTAKPLVTESHPEARTLAMLREELKALNARVVEIKRKAHEDHEALMVEIRARDAHITDLRHIIEQKDKALDFLQARLDALAKTQDLPELEPSEDEKTGHAEEPPTDPLAQARRIAREMQAAGAALRPIAEALNAQGIPTATGRGSWHASTVRALLA